MLKDDKVISINPVLFDTSERGLLSQNIFVQQIKYVEYWVFETSRYRFNDFLTI